MSSNKNIKLKIKTGDNVLIISGDHKGETGKVVKVFRTENRAIVEGLNMVKRHVKPSAQSPGGIVEKESPIHISNLMLIDSKGVASKVRYELKDGNKLRVSKKTNEII